MLGNNKKSIGFENKIYKSGGASFQGILDLYPNANARGYSFYKQLKASATKAFVQRSGAGGSIDATFLNNYVNESILTTFLGVNDGFVSTIYEQNGSGKDAIQTTLSKQTKNAIGGTLTKQGLKCVSQWTSADLNSYVKTNDVLTEFTIYIETIPNYAFGFWMGLVTLADRPIPMITQTYGAVFRYEPFQYVPSYMFTGFKKIAMTRKGSSLKIYENGILKASDNSSTLGNINFNQVMGEAFGNFYQGQTSTFIVYPVEQSAATVAAISALI